MCSRIDCQQEHRAGTEFKLGTGNMPPSTCGQGGHNIFCPPIFCAKKCSCANFMVTLLLETFRQHEAMEQIRTVNIITVDTLYIFTM